MASPVTRVWRGCVPPTPPNQFSSSSPEVRTWRQEYGSIFQQLESSPAAWGSRWRGLSPTSVLRLKCYGLSPFLEQIHISTSPSFPHCPVMGFKSLVPLPCSLCMRTSKPIWFSVPRRKQVEISLIFSQRRRGATWSRSSNVKAKLSSGVLSPPQTFWPLSLG